MKNSGVGKLLRRGSRRMGHNSNMKNCLHCFWVDYFTVEIAGTRCNPSLACTSCSPRFTTNSFK